MKIETNGNGIMYMVIRSILVNTLRKRNLSAVIREMK